MRISDWSSDVCSSDLAQLEVETGTAIAASVDPATLDRWRASVSELRPDGQTQQSWLWAAPAKHSTRPISEALERIDRSEEHTSELKSLMRSSSAVFCVNHKFTK